MPVVTAIITRLTKAVVFGQTIGMASAVLIQFDAVLAMRSGVNSCCSICAYPTLPLAAIKSLLLAHDFGRLFRDHQVPIGPIFLVEDALVEPAVDKRRVNSQAARLGVR